MNTQKTNPFALALLPLAAVFLLLAACSPGAAGGLQSLDGTWQVNLEQTREQMSEEQLAEAGGMIGMLASMQFTFDTAAQTVTFSWMGQEEVDSFSVLSADGDTVVIVPADDSQEDSLTIRFLDNNTILMMDQSDAETPPMVLTRQ